MTFRSTLKKNLEPLSNLLESRNHPRWFTILSVIAQPWTITLASLPCPFASRQIISPRHFKTVPKYAVVCQPYLRGCQC